MYRVTVFLIVIFALNSFESARSSNLGSELREFWEKTYNDELYVFESKLPDQRLIFTLKRFSETPNGTFNDEGFSFRILMNFNQNYGQTILVGYCDLTGNCNSGEGDGQPLIIAKFDRELIEVDLSRIPLANFLMPDAKKSVLHTCYRFFRWNLSKSQLMPKCKIYPPSFANR